MSGSGFDRYKNLTKPQLWRMLQEAEQQSEGDESPGLCDGGCCQEARVHLKKYHGYPYQVVQKGAGFGVGGVQVTYCPFCGRKLNA